MNTLPRWSVALLAGAAFLSGIGSGSAQAEPKTAAALAPSANPANLVAEQSVLNGPLMYQLLIAEISLRQGDTGTAFHFMLEAARQSADEKLFRRTVDIALRVQDGTQALNAARDWRTALPQSREAAEYVAQILLALNRPAEASEPLRALLELTPTADRAKVAATIPAVMSRLADRNMAAKLIDEITEPLRHQAPTIAASAWVASGRGWLAAADSPKALEAVKKALTLNPSDDAAALLCAELMTTQPAAEALLKAQVQLQPGSPAVRLAYARRLAETSRMAEAAEQLEAVTRLTPTFPGPWLSLGAVRLQLRQPQAATVALERFLAERAKQGPSRVAAEEDEEDDDEEGVANVADALASDEQLLPAYLMLSQAAQESGQIAVAQQWLDKIPASSRNLAVQIRRASLLAKQGKTDQARALIRRSQANSDLEVRGKFAAESALLREARRWKDAYAVMGEATAKFPNDPELLYDRAMLAEKLKLVDEMEKMLRKVIAIKPDHYNAYNALGYSLADRNLRLKEARQLIQRALDLSPGDPYIVDSLGWVEYRLGRLDEAAKLLRQAYQARADIEIGAHLGEVLWVNGQQEEAKRIWRESSKLEADHPKLQETLKRLKVTL